VKEGKEREKSLSSLKDIQWIKRQNELIIRKVEMCYYKESSRWEK